MQIKYLDFQEENRLRGADYQKAIKRVMENGVYVLGDEVKKFENSFALFTKSKYCIGVANGLEALQISLMALGVGKGDEVLTTPISAVATTLAILAVGANPVFIDVNQNGQMDENLIEKAITKNTKAVIPVHLYGQPLEIEKIRKICDEHKLFLIEDACQAHGTKFNGKMVGSFGETACYSFYPTKNLGAIGDGGAITTNDKNLADIIYQIRDYGQIEKYKHIRYGLNSRLDELQAGILNEKLKNLELDNLRRLEIAKRYIKNLSGIKNLEIILPNNIEDSNFHLFVIKTDKRNQLKKYLAENGIPSLIHYPITIPDQPMFDGEYKNINISRARKFVEEILSLPCHPFLKNEEIDYISGKIIDLYVKEK